MTKFILTCTLLLSASQAFAMDCPIKMGDETYLDKVASAIQATKTCEDAYAMAGACEMGSSGDAYTVPVAERKCGLDFWTKLSASEKRIYNGLQRKCDDKFRNMQGTMYISFNAFCHLNVARLYSELYTPAE